MPNVRMVAVWLREAEWLCSDAAHRLPAGEYTPEEQAALADALDQLASAVRLHARRNAPTTAELPAGE